MQRTKTIHLYARACVHSVPYDSTTLDYAKRRRLEHLSKIKGPRSDGYVAFPISNLSGAQTTAFVGERERVQ